MADLLTEIDFRIRADLSDAPSVLKRWASYHLITPKKIELKTEDGEELWLISRGRGIRHSGYCVVFGEKSLLFGLIKKKCLGKPYFLRFYASFLDAVCEMWAI